MYRSVGLQSHFLTYMSVIYFAFFRVWRANFSAVRTHATSPVALHSWTGIQIIMVYLAGITFIKSLFLFQQGTFRWVWSLHIQLNRQGFLKKKKKTKHPQNTLKPLHLKILLVIIKNEWQNCNASFCESGLKLQYRIIYWESGKRRKNPHLLSNHPSLPVSFSPYTLFSQLLDCWEDI